MKGNVLHTCRAPTDVAPAVRGWLMPASCLILPVDLCRPALGPYTGEGKRLLPLLDFCASSRGFGSSLRTLTAVDPCPSSGCLLSTVALDTTHPEGRRHPLVTAEVMACCQGQASHPPWSLPSAKHFQGTSTASSLLILPYPWGVGSTAVRRER